MSDEDSFTGRVRRYARVGGAVGGLAARLAGERYLGLAIDRERHAADLSAALGGIKGPLMKVAQLLATIPDALPEEYVRELIQLQEPSGGRILSHPPASTSTTSTRSPLRSSQVT